MSTDAGHGAEPLVSVITPVYNGARFIGEAIESVRAQTYGNWRHVVVDNVSTDGTADIVRRHSDEDERVTLVSADEFVPVIANWNRAAAHAHPGAAYLKFVHADDRLFPECLARMVDVAERNPSVGLVGAYRVDDRWVNCDGVPLDREVIPGRELGHDLLLGENYPFLFGSPTTTMIRAGLPSRPTIYDEGFLHADTEASYAILAEADFGYVHQVLTYTRRHDAAVTPYAQRVGTYLPEYIAMFRRYGAVFLAPDEYERRLSVHLWTYGRYLAARPLKLREEAYREYHRERLAGLAREIGPGELGRGVGRQVRRMARKQARRLPGARR